MKKLKYILFIGIFFLGGITTMPIMAQEGNGITELEGDEKDDAGISPTTTTPAPTPTNTGGFESTTVVGGKGPSHGLGTRSSPIDMYEGILMIVAFLLVIGYYYNERNKRITNS